MGEAESESKGCVFVEPGIEEESKTKHAGTIIQESNLKAEDESHNWPQRPQMADPPNNFGAFTGDRGMMYWDEVGNVDMDRDMNSGAENDFAIDSDCDSENLGFEYHFGHEWWRHGSYAGFVRRAC